MFIVIAEKTQGLPILFISLTKPTWLGDSISSNWFNLSCVKGYDVDNHQGRSQTTAQVGILIVRLKRA